jgi:hypothetical protein
LTGEQIGDDGIEAGVIFVCLRPCTPGADVKHEIRIPINAGTIEGDGRIRNSNATGNANLERRSRIGKSTIGEDSRRGCHGRALAAPIRPQLSQWHPAEPDLQTAFANTPVTRDFVSRQLPPV